VFTQGSGHLPGLPHDRSQVLGGDAVEVQVHLDGPLDRGALRRWERVSACEPCAGTLA
jgi:hypothetical protein